jgi:hypothetical protein
VIASVGLPVPAVVGARFALETGRGRRAVPVRSALLGASLAVALVVATFTFGSGLHSLVSNPALYGWEWSYMLNASNVVPPQALSLLDQDPHVVAWTGYDDLDAEIDGQDVPFLIEDGQPADKGQAVPPVLAGHTIDAKDQVVLGAASLAQLHKHVGDTVVVTYGTPLRRTYLPPADPPRHCRYRHHARHRRVQRPVRPHLDGDRSTGLLLHVPRRVPRSG